MGCGCKQSNKQKPVKQIVKRTPNIKTSPSIRRTIVKRPAK